MNYSVFINYRRDDSSGEAKLIRDALAREFGEEHVFMDVSSIEPGAEWPKQIRDKLNSAKAVIVVIGRNWLHAGLDEWARRRIDQPSDWVRREIEFVLNTRKTVIPVLVRNGKIPPPKVLPGSIRKLAKKQSIEIRSESWDHDTMLLLGKLARADTRRKTAHDGVGPYPKSDLEAPEPISHRKLERIIKNELPMWTCRRSSLPENSKITRVELFRQFKFKHFTEVMRFMEQMARGCDEVNHHPRWENIFKTLRVYLSTWDKKVHAVTDRDVQLARYFDAEFAKFPGRATKAHPPSKHS